MLLILALIYVGLGCYAYFFSDKIAFQPPPATYKDSSEIIKLRTEDGNTISALYLPSTDAEFAILYSHGNAEDLGDVRSVLEIIRRAGFSVFAYDYPGYGTSSGKPSEQSAYRAEDAAYDYLSKQLNVPPNRIVAYGRSLGGAVAIDLAARKPVAGLIVESSFVSGFRVLTRISIYPFDKFRSLDKIKQVNCPTLVIHGRGDEVIAFWHGERLFKEANEPKMSLWVAGAGHNNVPDVAGETYVATLHNFAQTIRNETGLESQ
jgi:fermentation-respiration switch protein FrsA (DUF1100 family)